MYSFSVEIYSFSVEMYLFSVELYAINMEMNTDGVEILSFSVEIEPNDVEMYLHDAEQQGFDAEDYPNDVEMRWVDIAMQILDVEISVDFPLSVTFISTSNKKISTSIRDGVEKYLCTATPRSFDVAVCGAGVEEWAMDVEDAPSDVAEISSRAAPGSLTACR
jgi:hypothetical protein